MPDVAERGLPGPGTGMSQRRIAPAQDHDKIRRKNLSRPIDVCHVADIHPIADASRASRRLWAIRHGRKRRGLLCVCLRHEADGEETDRKLKNQFIHTENEGR